MPNSSKIITFDTKHAKVLIPLVIILIALVALITNLLTGGKYSADVSKKITNKEVTSVGNPMESKTLNTVTLKDVTIDINGTNILVTTSITNPDDDFGTITKTGFEYTPANLAFIPANFKTISGSNTKDFQATITNLEPGTKYIIRAFTETESGTTYSLIKEFTTNQTNLILPILKVTNSTIKSSTSINLKGTISNTGYGTINETGFQYSTLISYTSPAKIMANSVSNEKNEFTTVLSGLTSGKTYYIRAYAITSDGTGYSPWVSVKTLAK